MGIVIVHTPQVGFRNSLKKWLAAGIHMVVDPDALINPYLNTLMMTTKQVSPAENITVEQAVIAYTKGSAFAEFSEKFKGMLAALKVLSQDIFSISTITRHT